MPADVQPARTEEPPEPLSRTAPVSPFPSATQADAVPYEQPQIHIQRAIEQLEARESKIKAEIVRLEELRAEADAIAKEREVLSDALAKLRDAAKSQSKAKSAA